MCALSVNAQLEHDHSLEWWMHYQIPVLTLHLYFDDHLAEKKSTLPPSKDHPHMVPGNGLFTTKDRKKGDYLCQFPGYWLHESLQEAAVKDASGDAYAFTTPKRTLLGP